MFRTGLDYLDSLPSGSTPLSMSFTSDAFGRLSEIRDTRTGGTGDISMSGYVDDQHATTATDPDEGDRFACDDLHRLAVAWLGLDGGGMAAQESMLLAGGVAAAVSARGDRSSSAASAARPPA